MIRNLIYTINSVFSIFYFIILIRCALSFLPSINWQKQPFYSIKAITDLYLDIFKKFIPPIGMLDVSPIVAIIALGVIQNVLLAVLSLFVK